MKLKKTNFFICLIIFIGLFVHSFVIPIPGVVNLRFYLLTVFILFVFNIYSLKIKITRSLSALMPIYLYWFLQIFYLLFTGSDLLFDHILTMFVITLFIGISELVLADVGFFMLSSDNILKSIFIVFTFGLFLYFYVIIKYGLQYLWLNELTNKGGAIVFNKLSNVVKMDQGIIPRNCGFYTSPNFWAGFCIFGLFVLLYIKQVAKVEKKWFLRAFVVVSLSLFLTFSRGSILAVLVGISFYIFPIISFSKIYKFFLKTFIVLVIISLISFSYFDLGKISTVLDNKFNSKNVSGDARFRIWKCHLESYSEHPIFGEGLQLSKEVYVSTINPPGYAGSHNVFLNLLNYTGFVGITIFLFILLYIVFISRIKEKRYSSLKYLYRLASSIIITLLVYSFFEHAFVTLFFWLLITLSIVIIDYTPKNEKLIS